MTLPRRRLGRTNLMVSEIGLGGLFTSTLGGGVSATTAILDRASFHGINFIDTAPAYADSEATLGQAFAAGDKKATPSDEPLILCTKLGGRPLPFDPRDRRALRDSVKTSLRLLGRDQIDLLLIHEPDRPRQYSWWSDYSPLAGPVLDVLDDVKSEGLIRFTGLGGSTVNEMTALVQTGRFDVLLTAFQYNTIFREAFEELIPAAFEHEMGIVVGSVLGQGSLARCFQAAVHDRPVWMSRRRQTQLQRLYTLVERIGMSLPMLGLRTILADERVSCVLVGAKNCDQLDGTVAASRGGPLPADVGAELDDIAAMLPHRPFEEPMILPLGNAYFGPGMANVGAATPVGDLRT